MSRHWEDAEYQEALGMLMAGEPDSAFLTRFGKTKKSVESRKHRLAFGAAPRIYAKTRSKSFGPTCLDRVIVPARSLMEARLRATAPRSVTAWICGDPAPGTSALDRRVTS